MRLRRIVARSLVHYWPTQLAIVAGVAVSVATLAGALLVGDSVRSSLRALVLERLGNTHTVVTASMPFPDDLVRRLQAHSRFAEAFGGACPIMVGEGVVVHAGTRRLASRVQVYGVDKRFWNFHGRPPEGLERRSALLSPELARELDWKEGDSLLVTLQRQAATPAETLHGRRSSTGATLRVRGSRVLQAQDLGEFSILQRGAAVRTLFLPLVEVQRAMEQEGRVNALLLSAGRDGSREEGDLLRGLLRETLTPDDAGLRIRALEHCSCLSLEHEGGLLDEPVVAAARLAGAGLKMESQSIFSYVVNSIAHGEKSVPYSLVTGLESEHLAGIAGPEQSTEKEWGGSGVPIGDVSMARGREEGDRNVPPSEKTWSGAPGEGTVLSPLGSSYPVGAGVFNPRLTGGLTVPPPNRSEIGSTIAGTNPQSPFLLGFRRPQAGGEAPRKGLLAPLWINDWTARDLGIGPGTPVKLEYFLWDYRQGLSTRTADFRVAGVVPLSGATADRDLVPEFEGISQTESISHWDPPFPVDLSRIRRQDEDYWERYRTTPKAFLPLETARELWGSRFGDSTSLRFGKPEGFTLDQALDRFRESLLANLTPEAMGFSLHRVRETGIEASRGSTDFGEYFLYFSFFLVVSALLLTVLFFKLGLEQRLRQVGLFKALGISEPLIRRIFAVEGLVLAVAGSLLGLAGAAAYGWLMMWGLRTRWISAVGTTRLTLHVEPGTLLLGAAAGVTAAFLCILLTLRRLGKAPPRLLLAGEKEPLATGSGRRSLLAALALGAAGLIFLLAAILGWIGQTAGFFGSGALLLVSLLAFQWRFLTTGRALPFHGRGTAALGRIGLRNMSYRPGRSLLSIGLIALATFIIVTVGVFRREGVPSMAPESGTGGFALTAESSIPFFQDPDDPESRRDLNLDRLPSPEKLRFWSFRLRPGDDASCRNLYRPANPRILGAPSAFLELGRFSFSSSLASGDEGNPWRLLDADTGDDAVPAIADATSMAYSLHTGLGEEIVLERAEGEPVRLKLVGALSDSVLQGEVVISERNFLKLFPKQQGYRYFLIETPDREDGEWVERLEGSLSDYGFDATSTADRLASFHRVENTYLSTFQSLGALGLLLGTLGTAVILLRNVLERRRELALMRAVGYGSGHLGTMVLAENLLLVGFALVTGVSSALVAVAPVLAARDLGPSLAPTGALAGLVLLVGLLASLAAVAAAVRTPVIASLRSE